MAFKLNMPWTKGSKDNKKTDPKAVAQAEKATVTRSAREPEENKAKEPDAPVFLATDHPTLELARMLGVNWHAHLETDLYCAEPGAPKPSCFNDYIRDVTKRLQLLEKNPDMSFDGTVQIWISKDRLEAWMTVYPPAGEGSPISPDAIEQALSLNGVTEGIDESVLSRAKDPRNGIMYLLPIAKGKPAINGEDGHVESLIADREQKYEADETGKINFAEMNWIINVVKGERICQIFHATDGTPGMDVSGNEVQPKKGRPAPRVNGKNTEIVEGEDGCFVVASEEGQLLHAGDKYSINQVLTIKGDVDYSTGNIKSHSTVVINGSVRPNFKVETTKDVIVRGSVEWGTIIAGHDITVLGGVTAGEENYLQAGNSIRCKFMENGRAYCKGDAYFENVVLCDINAEGSIYVTSGRGTAIAGRLNAMGDIRVNTVGNRSYRATEVRLGATAKFMDEYESCRAEADAAAQMVDVAKANIRKLEKLPPSPKKKQALDQQRAMLQTATKKVEDLEFEVDQMTEKLNLVKRHRIYVDRAYPNVTIAIGDEVWPLKQEARYATFILRDHEIDMITNNG